MKKTLALAIISLPGFLLCEAHAQWIKPYPNGSADDHLIRFDAGPTGDVTAPSPAVGVGYTYSAASSSQIISGWNLTASGAVGFGDGSSFSAQSNAFSSAGGENLRFGTDTDHQQDLLNAVLPMTWEGNATIPGSQAWVTATNQFRYNFDLALDHNLVDDFASIYDNYNLTITDGTNTLYSGIGLKNILGVATIDQNMYHDVFVSFNYDPADGPLTITWSGAVDMTGEIIDALGNGKKDILRVHQPSITTAIPEPSTYALLFMSFVSGAAYLKGTRKRKHPICS